MTNNPELVMHARQLLEEEILKRENFKMSERELTGYPSIDKPWLKWYDNHIQELSPCDDINIYMYLRKLSKNRLQEIAIQYFGKKYTYGELLEKIDRVADSFRNYGIKEKDIVTLSLPNIPENIFCFYALNKIGAIVNFIDLRLKGAKLVEVLNSINTTFIVATDIFIDELLGVLKDTKLVNVVVVSPVESLSIVMKRLFYLKNKTTGEYNNVILWKDFVKNSKPVYSDFMGEKKSVACILHTSGTTGKPKKVMLTNEAFIEMYVQIVNANLEIFEKDIFLSQVPPFLAYSIVMAINTPLLMGLRIVLLPNYEPEKFADNIYKYKPNHVIAGPADWLNFLENNKVPKRKYDFLVSLISGSDKIDIGQKRKVNELLSQCGCKREILEGYGMTEIASAAVMNIPSHNVEASVGIPLPKINLCVYDNERNCELGYGEVGEICMSGPTMMIGYYENEKDTNNMLKKHEDGRYWLHSGDLGIINHEGNLFLKGRLKRIIVRHDGMKISPYDVEKIILTHKDILECCVVGKEDNEHGNGEVAVAYITLRNDVFRDETIILEELQKLCMNNLQEIYRPTEIYIIEKIPLTENGKVDYRALEVKPNAKNVF